MHSLLVCAISRVLIKSFCCGIFIYRVNLRSLSVSKAITRVSYGEHGFLFCFVLFFFVKKKKYNGFLHKEETVEIPR